VTLTRYRNSLNSIVSRAVTKGTWLEGQNKLWSSILHFVFLKNTGSETVNDKVL
jgi:hypothetical protein